MKQSGERLTAGMMCLMTDHANAVTLSWGTTAAARRSMGGLVPLAAGFSRCGCAAVAAAVWDTLDVLQSQSSFFACQLL